MSPPDYFSALAGYHAWATHRLIDHSLAALSDEQWRRDCGLFFRSVHRTVNHLLVGDDLWYARLAEGRSPRIALDAELHADRIALCAALGAAVDRWSAWVGTLGAERLAGELVYVRGNGQTVHVPFAAGLGHVFNHATHHRGQISAALTAMGQPGPELDWIIQLQQEMKTP